MSVIMAFMLIATLSLSALAIGISQMQLARNEALIVADCASLSASIAIGETLDDPALNPALLAQNIVSLNQIAGKAAAVSDGDVILGSATRNAQGVMSFEPNAQIVNAVRVNVRLDDGAAMAKQSFFFPFMDSNKAFRVEQHSVSAKVGVDIALVIDRSQSMRQHITGGIPPALNPNRPFAMFYPHPTQSRWAGMLNSIDVLFDELKRNRIDERVALVTFGSDRSIELDGETIFFPGSRIDIPFTKNVNRIKTELVNMWNVYPMVSGQTWIDAGIDDAIEILTSDANRSFAVKIMVVLTDGQQFPQNTKHFEAAQRAAAQGITIHTIAYSVGAGAEEMQTVASIGGGQAFEATSVEALQSAFAEIGKLTSTAIIE